MYSNIKINNNNHSSDAYRRFQDQDIDEKSIGSGTDADPDEYNTLINETFKKTTALQDSGGGIGGAGLRGRKSFKICVIGFIIVSLFSLLSTINLPLSNVRNRIGSIPGWSFNTSRHTMDYILPTENTTILEPANICTEERSSEKIFLLIFVCSSAKNFEARQTIRETWGNVSEFNYPYFAKFHSALKGKYLETTSTHWKEYALVTDTNVLATLSTTSTSSSTSTVDNLHIEQSKRTNNNNNNDNNKNNNKNNNTNNHNSSHPKDALNQSINIKVVFLLGQTDFHRKASTPKQRQTTEGGNNNNNDETITFDEDEIDELQLRINNESEVYGDIIQENFIDSYNNLTLKSIMMLKWVTNNCVDKVKYIMKCDDDTFINIPNLVQILLGGTVPLYKASLPFYDRNTIAVKSKKNRLVEAKRLLIGFLFCEVRPIADVTSKWYCPNYMYGGEFYPNYLSGTAYLMSFDAARLLYRVSLNTPVFHLEDVYITGIVASRVNLKRYHHPLFFYSYTKDLCALRGMISQHQLQPNDIRNAYEFIINMTIVCNGPEKNFSMAKMKLQQRKRCQ